MLELLTDVATIIGAVLAVVTFIAYFTVARWWTTRSGTAVFILYTALLLLGGHVVLQIVFEHEAPIRRFVVIVAVTLALAWNLGTILWKQYRYRHADHEET